VPLNEPYSSKPSLNPYLTADPHRHSGEPMFVFPNSTSLYMLYV